MCLCHNYFFFAKRSVVSAPCDSTVDCSPNQEDMCCNERTSVKTPSAIFFAIIVSRMHVMQCLFYTLVPRLCCYPAQCLLCFLGIASWRLSCTWCFFIADCKGKKQSTDHLPSVSCENLDIWTCPSRARKQLERHQSIFFASRTPDAQGCPALFWAGINTQYLMRRPIIQADLWKPSRSRQALFPFQHVESYSSPVSNCVCQAKQVATVQYKIVF